MQVIIDLPKDLSMLQLILDKSNLQILQHIQGSENHSLRAIEASTGINHEKARGRIKQLRRAGVLKIDAKARGRRGNRYKIVRIKRLLAAVMTTT